MIKGIVEGIAAPGVGAVIFDMDGLMFDSERLARRAWRAALADHGYALDDDVYLSVVGRTTQEARAIFAQTLGPGLPIDDVAADAARHLRDLLLPVPPLKPGLVALLDGIDDLGLPTAVASSTAHAEVERRLVAAGLRRRFAAVAGGDEVAHGKPAPDVFVLAGERLGMAPDRCLVLEDSEAGIAAAAAAGMVAVMIPDLVKASPAVREKAAAVVASLSDVLAVLRPLVS